MLNKCPECDNPLTPVTRRYGSEEVVVWVCAGCGGEYSKNPLLINILKKIKKKN